MVQISPNSQKWKRKTRCETFQLGVGGYELNDILLACHMFTVFQSDLFFRRVEKLKPGHINQFVISGVINSLAFRSFPVFLSFFSVVCQSLTSDILDTNGMNKAVRGILT
jgi:hypothetical protein